MWQSVNGHAFHWTKPLCFNPNLDGIGLFLKCLARTFQSKSFLSLWMAIQKAVQLLWAPDVDLLMLDQIVSQNSFFSISNQFMHWIISGHKSCWWLIYRKIRILFNLFLLSSKTQNLLLVEVIENFLLGLLLITIGRIKRCSFCQPFKFDASESSGGK